MSHPGPMAILRAATGSFPGASGISKAGKIVRSQLAGIQRKMYKIVPTERQELSEKTITKNRCKPSKNGLQRSFLAPPAGFEPVACRLGVDPIRHREVTSNA